MRILETLLVQEFVRERANKTYLLGNEFLRIGIDFVNRLDLKEAAAGYLQELAEKTRATCHLAVPSGEKTLVIAVHQSSERLRAISEPGLLADLHSTSTGKCFLATHCESPAEMTGSQILRKHTSNTILDPGVLENEIEKVKRLGFAIDDEENLEGIRGCAAPVRNATGNVIAAIGIVAPVSVFPVDDDDNIAAEVCDCAARLSRKIGYHPNR